MHGLGLGLGDGSAMRVAALVANASPSRRPNRWRTPRLCPRNWERSVIALEFRDGSGAWNLENGILD